MKGRRNLFFYVIQVKEMGLFTDKKPLPHSKMVGGNLRLINVDMDDAGVYVCGINGTISGRMPETLLTVTSKWALWIFC